MRSQLPQHVAAAASATSSSSSSSSTSSSHDDRGTKARRLPGLPKLGPPHQIWARAQHLLIRHALPIGFLVGLIWALTWPEPGQAVSDIVVGRTARSPKGLRLVEFLNNCCVFLVSGLTLRMSDFHNLARNWAAVVYGIVAILLLTPVLALLAKVLPLQPPEFAVGLAIFTVVPTTLGVGVALTQVSHGNQALSLLLTVVTNLLGVVTVPYLLHAFLSTGGGKGVVSVKPSTLAYKLLLTVLIPTLVGMAIRASHPKVRGWITRHKTKLSLFSTANLVMIIWQTLSAARSVLLKQSGAHLVLVAVAAIAQHLILLALNWVAARPLMRLPLSEAVAVTIMASQKSAPVAVTVISYISDDVAQQGLFAIPCLIGQLSQIFIGSVYSGYFANWIDRDAAAHAAQQGRPKEEVDGAELPSYQSGREAAPSAAGKRQAEDDEEGKSNNDGGGENEEVVEGIL